MVMSQEYLTFASFHSRMLLQERFANRPYENFSLANHGKHYPQPAGGSPFTGTRGFFVAQPASPLTRR
jgi:hypothetical protein